jgi:hypothetical protein
VRRSGTAQTTYLFAGVDHPLRINALQFTCPTFSEPCSSSGASHVCTNHPSVACTSTPTPYYYKVDLVGNVRRLRDAQGNDLGGYRYTAPFTVPGGGYLGAAAGAGIGAFVGGVWATP